MALSPALTVTNLQPLFTVPVPAGTTFDAGEVVVRGSATSDSTVAFAGVSMYDYDALGSTTNKNAICITGRATFPKAAASSITAGTKVYWLTTTSVVSKVAPTTSVYGVPLGVCVTSATTTSTEIDVYFFPNP